MLCGSIIIITEITAIFLNRSSDIYMTYFGNHIKTRKCLIRNTRLIDQESIQSANSLIGLLCLGENEALCRQEKYSYQEYRNKYTKHKTYIFSLIGP